mgnify:CR=1 FL=1
MSFNISLYSGDGDGETGSKTYKFDWSFMEDGEYEMTWSFRTADLDEADYADSTDAMYLSLPQLPTINNYEVKSSNAQNYSRAVSSSKIGLLRRNTMVLDLASASKFVKIIYTADTNDNPPIRCRKPQMNDFRVDVFNVNNSLMGDEGDANGLQNYFLNLYFKKI